MDCAQNNLKSPTHTVPVFSSFILKHTVTVLNLLSGQSVHPDIWILLCYSSEGVEGLSFPILPHVPFRTPEHVCGVCWLPEIVCLVFHQQGNAGVRHNSYTGATPYIFLIPRCGCIVHPDHTFNLVYLFSDTCPQHLTWAGDQGTLAAVQIQELMRKSK